ncbi:MAG: LysM peptidoglycan-binding domain-containing protein [Candidatus Saccharibacteria bacterium]|nr:LysM peptidoglycan-binding domain-containing protein [Rhodoferax sp.]
MTTHLMAKNSWALAFAAAYVCLLGLSNAAAQNFPITEGQRQTANQVAQAGVPVSEIAANAPDRYTVKSGDTLWAISRLFLKGPWRWPELWGMNLKEVRNPHLIYPGQVLVLERKDGRATLRLAGAEDGQYATDGTVRVSPRTRYEALSGLGLPTLRSSAIEPFLAEPVVVDETTLQMAPRIVSAQEGRVLLTRGDRAYARGPADAPLMDDQARLKQYRVFRNATPLKDPVTKEVLGYEAQYVGKATLVRGETTAQVEEKSGTSSTAIVPATIDIIAAKEEMRVGDRLLPEPPRQLQSYTPHAPPINTDGRIVSVYGSAVVNAAQNQVVAINRGTRDGIEIGHVMAIVKDGERVVDKSDPARPLMKLPDERNGLLMVFRTFDRVSYALILEITDGVRVGDRLISP